MARVDYQNVTWTREAFKRQLPFGQKYERVLVPYFEELFDSKLDSFCDNSKFDIKLKNGKTIEVKADSSENSTFSGNMVVETSSNGKRSGIMVSQADYFVVFYPFLKECVETPYNVYIFNTQLLKNFIVSRLIDEHLLLSPKLRRAKMAEANFGYKIALSYVHKLELAHCYDYYNYNV